MLLFESNTVSQPVMHSLSRTIPCNSHMSKSGSTPSMSMIPSIAFGLICAAQSQPAAL